MNFNIITTSFNSEKTINDCFSSLNNQNYNKNNINWFLIDGSSKDNTVNLIKKFKSEIKKKIISEDDQGLYFAYNKGINQISDKENSVVNFLDSDNEYYSNDILKKVSEVFKNYDVDLVFTDLVYVGKNNKILRFWKSKPDIKFSKKERDIYFYNNFNSFDHFLGWSIPLPTIFLKTETLNKCGFFDTKYKICSDYHWTLRLSLIKNIKAAYIPIVSVRMRVGGVSNRFSNLFKIKIEDLKIIFKFYRKINFVLAIFFCFFTLIFKNLRKISQFFFKI